MPQTMTVGIRKPKTRLKKPLDPKSSKGHGDKICHDLSSVTQNVNRLDEKVEQSQHETYLTANVKYLDAESFDEICQREKKSQINEHSNLKRATEIDQPIGNHNERELVIDDKKNPVGGPANESSTRNKTEQEESNHEDVQTKSNSGSFNNELLQIENKQDQLAQVTSSDDVKESIDLCIPRVIDHGTTIRPTLDGVKSGDRLDKSVTTAPYHPHSSEQGKPCMDKTIPPVTSVERNFVNLTRRGNNPTEDNQNSTQQISEIDSESTALSAPSPHPSEEPPDSQNIQKYEVHTVMDKQTSDVWAIDKLMEEMELTPPPKVKNTTHVKSEVQESDKFHYGQLVYYMRDYTFQDGITLKKGTEGTVVGKPRHHHKGTRRVGVNFNIQGYIQAFDIVADNLAIEASLAKASNMKESSDLAVAEMQDTQHKQPSLSEFKLMDDGMLLNDHRTHLEFVKTGPHFAAQVLEFITAQPDQFNMMLDGSLPSRNRSCLEIRNDPMKQQCERLLQIKRVTHVPVDPGSKFESITLETAPIIQKGPTQHMVKVEQITKYKSGLSIIKRMDWSQQGIDETMILQYHDILPGRTKKTKISIVGTHAKVPKRKRKLQQAKTCFTLHEAIQALTQYAGQLGSNTNQQHANDKTYSPELNKYLTKSYSIDWIKCCEDAKTLADKQQLFINQSAFLPQLMKDNDEVMIHFPIFSLKMSDPLYKVDLLKKTSYVYGIPILDERVALLDSLFDLIEANQLRQARELQAWVENVPDVREGIKLIFAILGNLARRHQFCFCSLFQQYEKKGTFGLKHDAPSLAVTAQGVCVILSHILVYNYHHQNAAYTAKDSPYSSKSKLIEHLKEEWAKFGVKDKLSMLSQIEQGNTLPLEWLAIYQANGNEPHLTHHCCKKFDIMNAARPAIESTLELTNWNADKLLSSYWWRNVDMNDQTVEFMLRHHNVEPSKFSGVWKLTTMEKKVYFLVLHTYEATHSKTTTETKVLNHRNKMDSNATHAFHFLKIRKAAFAYDLYNVRHQLDQRYLNFPSSANIPKNGHKQTNVVEPFVSGRDKREPTSVLDNLKQEQIMINLIQATDEPLEAKLTHDSEYKQSGFDVTSTDANNKVPTPSSIIVLKHDTEGIIPDDILVNLQPGELLSDPSEFLEDNCPTYTIHMLGPKEDNAELHDELESNISFEDWVGSLTPKVLLQLTPGNYLPDPPDMFNSHYPTMLLWNIQRLRDKGTPVQVNGKDCLPSDLLEPTDPAPEITSSILSNLNPNAYGALNLQLMPMGSCIMFTRENETTILQTSRDANATRVQQYAVSQYTPSFQQLGVDHVQQIGKGELTQMLKTKEYVQMLISKVTTTCENMRHMQVLVKESQKINYDNHVQTSHSFKRGDKVILHQPKMKKGIATKCIMQWTGPYSILKCCHNEVNFVIQNMKNKKIQKVHARRLKLFIAADEINDPDTEFWRIPEESQIPSLESEESQDINTNTTGNDMGISNSGFGEYVVVLVDRPERIWMFAKVEECDNEDGWLTLHFYYTHNNNNRDPRNHAQIPMYIDPADGKDIILRRPKSGFEPSLARIAFDAVLIKDARINEQGMLTTETKNRLAQILGVTSQSQSSTSSAKQSQSQRV